MRSCSLRNQKTEVGFLVWIQDCCGREEIILPVDLLFPDPVMVLSFGTVSLQVQISKRGPKVGGD